MYPGKIAQMDPDRAALIMADSGEVMTYRELETESNRIAHLFRQQGLRTGDHIALMLPNHRLFLPICWAAQRSGLYYTAISWRLQEGEVAYILDDCKAKVFISSASLSAMAASLARQCKDVVCYSIDQDIPGFSSLQSAIEKLPETPIADESEGADMLYSSGTTGRPKGIKVPLPNAPLGTPTALLHLIRTLYVHDDEPIRYLSPAPLYHAAPLRYNMTFQRMGGTCIIMEHFDAQQALALIERYKITHSQWVPTMFIRMLKLPEEIRNAFNVSSLKVAVHAAAPCPIAIKEQMIAWWGPVLYEYYAGTEGNGFCAINSQEWLAHKGSVGRALLGEVRILDDAENELPPSETGGVYFANGPRFEYHNDTAKTESTRSHQGYSTLGDVGYLDADGYLYLTDRKAYMIISGGVNIYPQEVEDVLITHPEVTDVAVFGIPNDDFGEEVKAVVQPSRWPLSPEEAQELEAELSAFCKSRIASLKCPRSIDFEEELPRHPTGKLLKRLLKDRYWKT